LAVLKNCPSYAHASGGHFYNSRGSGGQWAVSAAKSKETTMPARSQTSRLGRFVTQMTRLVSTPGLAEADLLGEAGPHLGELIATDDWLPDSYALPDAKFYSQYLLYCDPLERFSVVSFVWGPGQSTPIHNHTVWGLIGMLRGAEIAKRYKVGKPMVEVAEDRLEPGMIDIVSPAVGDIHRVANAFHDRDSISIHVYGANIGTVERNVFDQATGARKSFVSGYMNRHLPNLWSGVNL